MIAEIAILAGGCFWGMEDLIRNLPGVTDTEVGYTGGFEENATYEQVKKGNTGHAEAIQVKFDPKKLTYSQLIEFFFTIHDPTTKNRQGNDIGSQYRSVIFYLNVDQKRVAEEKIKWAKTKWNKEITTEVVKAKTFIPAEGYHQDYLKKNPGGYTCHYVRSFK